MDDKQRYIFSFKAMRQKNRPHVAGGKFFSNMRTPRTDQCQHGELYAMDGVGLLPHR